jgi:hypothetical protein
LTGIELRNDTLQHLVDDGWQDALIVICSEGPVDLGQGIDSRPGKDTTGDINHLQVLGTSEGRDVARLCADIVHDGGFEPWDSNMGSCGENV